MTTLAIRWSRSFIVMFALLFIVEWLPLLLLLNSQFNVQKISRGCRRKKNTFYALYNTYKSKHIPFRWIVLAGARDVFFSSFLVHLMLIHSDVFDGAVVDRINWNCWFVSLISNEFQQNDVSVSISSMNDAREHQPLSRWPYVCVGVWNYGVSRQWERERWFAILRLLRKKVRKIS